MKRLLTTLFISLLALAAIAQSVPQGMKYQAVARDHQGQILANQEIGLQIDLILDGKVKDKAYTETHQVVTNELGLFAITIGEGRLVSGDFTEVPWSEHEIWMQIGLDETSSGNYTTISSSRLLAVPYAFHAGSADKLSGSEEGGTRNGSAYWHVLGNSGTSSLYAFIGTRDSQAFVMKTNNTEAMRITAAGTIEMQNDLTVGNNALIGNDLDVVNNADIGNELNVNGIARFNNTAQSTTKDDGSVIVEGGVGIEKNVNVGGDSKLTGTLGVDGIARFNNTTQSTTKDDGSVIVEGGVGVEKNLNVGGDSKLIGTLGVDGLSSLNNGLNVTGGTPTVLTGTLNVNQATDLDNTLNVDGVSTFNNTTESTSKDNGAVVVEGGVGIEKNLNVGGTSKLDGQVTIDAAITGGSQDDYTQYPLQVQGGDHGVAIQINNVTPDRNANFLTMFDGAGDPMGRIEGFQALTGVARATIENILNALEDDPDDVNDGTPTSADSPSSAAQFFNSDYGFGLLNETFDLVYGVIVFGINVTGCAAGFAILGDCDDAVWSGIGVGVQIVKLAGFLAYNEINRGVAFESGGADYAEWLEKADASEMHSFGDVVGVKGGFVSKSYLDAEQFMVISQNPTVIGAMPQTGEEFRYEKIAFMGQAPVKVVGVAKRGDYILPSGKGDGYAIAVAPEDMKTKDYSRIIGIAWGEADGEKMFEYVNTAVGINSNDLVNTVEQMQFLMNEMQRTLQKLDSDYQPHFYDVDNQVLANAAQISTADYNNFEQIAAQQMGITPNTSYQDAMTAIQDYTTQHGMNLNDYPYIVDVMNNPEDKELAQQMLDHYTSVLAKLEKIMSEIDRG